MYRTLLLIAAHCVSAFAQSAGAATPAKPPAKKPAASAAAPAVPPLQLVEPAKDGIAVSLKQIEQGSVSIPIYNASASPVQLTAAAVTLAPSRTAATAGFPIALTPGATPIPVHTSSFVKLAYTGAKPLPGTYAGVIALQDPSGVLALPRLSITVDVAAPAEPLLKKQTFVLWRIVPLFDWSVWWPSEFSIPLANPAALDAVGRTIGAAGREGGGWTLARWQQRSHGQGTATALAFTDPPSAGKYEGDLNLTAEPTKGTYPVVVMAKDIVLWPLLVVAVGVWLAYRVKRYTSVQRVVWLLRLEEAELGHSFRDSQTAFAAKTAGTSAGAYSVAADFEARRSAVREALTALEAGFASTLDGNTEYARVRDELATLGLVPAKWIGLGDGLSELIGPLNQIPNLATLPPFFAGASRLLTGKIVTVDELDGLRQQLTDAASLAENWNSAWQRVQEFQLAFAALPGTVQQAQGALGQSIRAVQTSLLQVQDAVGLASAAVGLSQVAQQLASLSAEPQPQTGAPNAPYSRWRSHTPGAVPTCQ